MILAVRLQGGMVESDQNATGMQPAKLAKYQYLEMKSLRLGHTEQNGSSSVISKLVDQTA